MPKKPPVPPAVKPPSRHDPFDDAPAAPIRPPAPLPDPAQVRSARNLMARQHPVPASASVTVRKDFPDAALFKDMRAAANLPAGVTVDHFRVWCDRATANGCAPVPWRTCWQEFVAERATWEKLFLAAKPPTSRTENQNTKVENSGDWRSRLTKIKP